MNKKDRRRGVCPSAVIDKMPVPLLVTFGGRSPALPLILRVKAKVIRSRGYIHKNLIKKPDFLIKRPGLSKSRVFLSNCLVYKDADHMSSTHESIKSAMMTNRQP